MVYYLEFILHHTQLTYYLNFVECKWNGWGLYYNTTCMSGSICLQVVSSPIGANEAFDENDHDYIKSQKVNSRPIFIYAIRRVWGYRRGNQNPYIEEEQTTQWPKEKAQKDKQRSTKHTYQTKDRVTRTLLKTGCELRCSGRVSSSCSTSGTRRVNLV